MNLINLKEHICVNSNQEMDAGQCTSFRAKSRQIFNEIVNKNQCNTVNEALYLLHGVSEKNCLRRTGSTREH